MFFKAYPQGFFHARERREKHYLSRLKEALGTKLEIFTDQKLIKYLSCVKFLFYISLEQSFFLYYKDVTQNMEINHIRSLFNLSDFITFYLTTGGGVSDFIRCPPVLILQNGLFPKLCQGCVIISNWKLSHSYDVIPCDIINYLMRRPSERYIIPQAY